MSNIQISWEQCIDQSTDNCEAMLTLLDQKTREAIAKGVNFLGQQIVIGARTEARLHGAALLAMQNPIHAAIWRLDNGATLQLSAPQILQLSATVAAHVQACLDRASYFASAIRSSQITDPEALNSGWPSA